MNRTIRFVAVEDVRAVRSKNVFHDSGDTATAVRSPDVVAHFVEIGIGAAKKSFGQRCCADVGAAAVQPRQDLRDDGLPRHEVGTGRFIQFGPKGGAVRADLGQLVAHGSFIIVHCRFPGSGGTDRRRRSSHQQGLELTETTGVIAVQDLRLLPARSVGTNYVKLRVIVVLEKGL